MNIGRSDLEPVEMYRTLVFGAKRAAGWWNAWNFVIWCTVG